MFERVDSGSALCTSGASPRDGRCVSCRRDRTCALWTLGSGLWTGVNTCWERLGCGDDDVSKGGGTFLSGSVERGTKHEKGPWNILQRKKIAAEFRIEKDRVTRVATCVLRAM